MLDEKELFKKVRRIEILSKKYATDLVSGQYQSVFRGQGMEFRAVREYCEGDDLRTIDWNVTAKYSHPYIKEFVEERELTIFFIVDTSASIYYGTLHQPKNEIVAEFCALLAFNALKKNDKVGLTLFSKDIELHLSPRKGKQQVLRMIRELLSSKRLHKQTNFDSIINFLLNTIKKHSIIFFISDFFDTNTYSSKFHLLNKKHDLILVNINDDIELEIPDIGVVNLRDVETNETILIDTSQKKWREAYTQTRKQAQEKMTNYFKKHKIDTLNLTTATDYSKLLSHFFNLRKKR